MPNQNPNGRNVNRDREDRPSWRNQDMEDDRHFDRGDRGDRDRGDRERGDRERMMRGGNESRWGSRRDWDDDEGYRSTERYGGGQSGYGAGRFGDDRSMGPGYRNQSSSNRSHEDRQGMHTDDRWQGRGGPQYWEDRNDRGYGRGGQGMDDRTERTGYHSGYNRGEGYGGYGQQGIQQNVGSQSGFRGGSGGAQFADEYNQNRGQGMGHQDQRQGGMMGSQGYYGQGGVGGGYGGSFGDQPGMQGGRGMQGGYAGSGMQGGNMGQGISHRGKGPQGWQRSDERIKEQVCEALSDDDHIDASNIEVQVKNGDVILTGTVEDRRTKRLAEDLVERLPGVKDVQNQLRVGSNNDKRGNQNTGSAVGKNETETSSTDRKHRA